MPQNWTSNQRKFIAWLATPKSEREPATHEAFAESIGVTSRTLRYWKQEPALWAEVHKQARLLLKEWLGDIFETLGRESARGNMTATRMVLESLGDLGPEHQQSQTINIQPFTAQELAVAQQQSDIFDSEVFGNGQG